MVLRTVWLKILYLKQKKIAGFFSFRREHAWQLMFQEYILIYSYHMSTPIMPIFLRGARMRRPGEGLCCVPSWKQTLGWTEFRSRPVLIRFPAERALLERKKENARCFSDSLGNRNWKWQVFVSALQIECPEIECLCDRVSKR